MFKLDDRLKADTAEITRLQLSYVGLMNDARFPWLILVPMRVDASELIDLNQEDRSNLMEEIAHCCKKMETLFQPHKLNVATLGNIVPQLHIHIIARNTDDPAWPAPVWGHGTPEPYSNEALQERCAKLRAALT